MRPNGFEQAGKAPRNVMLLVVGCSSCTLAVAGMLATGTEMLGVVSSVGLGMTIVVTRLARRMRHTWQQLRRQKDAAVTPSDVDRPLLPVEILSNGGSANRSQNAA